MTLALTPRTKGFIDGTLFMAGTLLVAIGAAGLATAKSTWLYGAMIVVGAVLIGAGVTHVVLFTRAALRRARLTPPDLSPFPPVEPSELPVVLRGKKQGRLTLAIVIYWTLFSLFYGG